MDINNNSNSNSNSNSTCSSGRTLPFDRSSFMYQSDHNPIKNFEVAGNYFSYIFEENNNIFLDNATISLKTRYNKYTQKADVNYTKIDIPGNNNNKQLQNLSIENIDEMNPEDYKGDFHKFLKYIKNVENELKEQYKCDDEIEIELKFTDKVKNNVTCEFKITNKKFSENSFKIEDILNTCDYYGLYCMLDIINGN